MWETGLVIGFELDPASLDASNLGSYEMRTISFSVDEAETDSVVNVASQLLSENILLSLLAGSFGLLLAYWLIRLIQSFKIR